MEKLKKPVLYGIYAAGCLILIGLVYYASLTNKELKNTQTEVLLNDLREMGLYWNEIQDCIHKTFETNKLQTRHAKSVLKRACENIIQGANFKVMIFIMDCLISELETRGYISQELFKDYIQLGMKRTYTEVICTETGTIDNHTFTKGEIYPICGTNNGKQLVCEDKDGDAKIIYLFDYGDLASADGDLTSARFEYIDRRL